MPYLLDTCAISEFVAPKPDRNAVEAMLKLPRTDIFLSAITVGELRGGIDELPTGRRKTFLENWFQSVVLALYTERTLALDTQVALRWGSLDAMLKRAGATMQIKDAMIVATALHHGLTLVTRNENDFSASGVAIFNPWT